MYQKQSIDYSLCEKAPNMLILFNKYRNVIIKNIETVSQYTQTIELLILQFKLNLILKLKENFLNEIEIRRELQKSSDFTASSDLLNKLNESLVINKKKLEYLEEDYFKHRNQIDQFKITLDSLRLKVEKLTKQKKEYFSNINKITREMGGNSNNQEHKLEDNLDFDENLTNSQRIRALQKRARETQNEINRINSRFSKTKLKYEEFRPLFETYEQDYQRIIEMIELDEKKISELESKLELKINISRNSMPLDKIKLQSIRTIQEIENDIKEADSEIKVISFQGIDPKNFNKCTNKIKEFDKFLSDNGSEIKIDKNVGELKGIFKAYQKFEIIVDELESIINKFLVEVNLKASFRLLLSKDNQKFIIQLNFIRNNKESIDFNELTTPEKIFFVIILYISFELQIDKHNIIFSNLIIPVEFNKAGSIFRTIRKIIPIFEKEKNFGKFNLIFIFSNLEMKKEVKNLKIIKIQKQE
ncbi:MAG TPA: hypothetical protein ENH98_04245 [archaeon]|nr:hypothetical protein [archaeon]